MSKTQSTMVALGSVAPAFELVDVVSGKAVGRDDVFAMVSDDARADGANCAARMPWAAGDVYLRALPVCEACGGGVGADWAGLSREGLRLRRSRRTMWRRIRRMRRRR